MSDPTDDSPAPVTRPTENTDPTVQGSTELMPGTTRDPDALGAVEGAADADKVSGIVEQVRADIQLGNVDDARSELEVRLAQAGVALTPEAVHVLVVEIEDDASR